MWQSNGCYFSFQRYCVDFWYCNRFDVGVWQKQKGKTIILYKCGSNWSWAFLFTINIVQFLERMKIRKLFYCLAFASMNSYWIHFPIMDFVCVCVRVPVCVLYVRIRSKRETMRISHQLGEGKRTDNLIAWKNFMWFYVSLQTIAKLVLCSGTGFVLTLAHAFFFTTIVAHAFFPHLLFVHRTISIV